MWSSWFVDNIFPSYIKKLCLTWIYCEMTMIYAVFRVNVTFFPLEHIHSIVKFLNIFSIIFMAHILRNLKLRKWEYGKYYSHQYLWGNVNFRQYRHIIRNNNNFEVLYNYLWKQLTFFHTQGFLDEVHWYTTDANTT